MISAAPTARAGSVAVRGDDHAGGPDGTIASRRTPPVDELSPWRHCDRPDQVLACRGANVLGKGMSAATLGPAFGGEQRRLTTISAIGICSGRGSASRKVRIQPVGLPDPNDVAAYEELEKRAIGGARPLAGPIELHDYDPRWPGQYAEHAARVRAALGERAIRIEHVGSTAVPGLAAKPIIDIVLEVPDSADEAAYVGDLEMPGTCCGFASRIGSSIGCSTPRARTSTSMSSRAAARRPSVWRRRDVAGIGRRDRRRPCRPTGAPRRGPRHAPRHPAGQADRDRPAVVAHARHAHVLALRRGWNPCGPARWHGCSSGGSRTTSGIVDTPREIARAGAYPFSVALLETGQPWRASTSTRRRERGKVVITSER